MSERSLHGFDDDTEQLAHRILDYVIDRIRMSPPPLDAPRGPAELAAATGETITDDGLGWERALALFREVLAPACISSDHPRYLGFVPTAPAEAATLFDLVVSASSIYGDWWIEGAGAIHAENQALRWLAGLAGLPETAGGVFVSGGTAGNLTAMTVARETWRERRAATASPASPACPAPIRRSGSPPRSSTCPSCSWTPTSAAASLVNGWPRPSRAPTSTCSRRSPRAARRTPASSTTSTAWPPCATSAACGCTSTPRTAVRRWWRRRPGRCSTASSGPTRSSWTPTSGCSHPSTAPRSLYRDPNLARAALTQQAGYLEVLTPTSPWNPSDLAIHMTRRVRGLPLWFSLAANGTKAYERAVERGLALAREAAHRIAEAPHLDLVMEPELSVVLFRRRGWGPDDYQRWSDEALASGLALLVPTVHEDETMFRFCFVNPLTTTDDIDLVLDAMRERERCASMAPPNAPSTRRTASRRSCTAPRSSRCPTRHRARPPGGSPSCGHDRGTGPRPRSPPVRR